MTRLRTLNYVAGLVLAATAIVASGCTDDSTNPTSKARTITGETKTLGNGTATSWLKLGDDGNPTAIGVTLSESALTGLPTSMTPPSHEYIFTFPQEAAATAYNHLSLDWNPLGHPPMEIYDMPHFDLHFYMISQSERDAITPADTVKGGKSPGADYIPAGYFTPPVLEIVPRMGVHYLDPLSHEFHGHSFDKTFIYGFWDGSMIFAEPMITLAYLQSKPSFTEALKLPAKYPKSGLYYATKYSIRHDAAKKEYTIALEGMTKR